MIKDHLFIDARTGQRTKRCEYSRDEDGKVVTREYAYVDGVESVAAILRPASVTEETILLVAEKRADIEEAKAELLATLPQRLQADPGLAGMLLATRGATLEELKTAGWVPLSKREGR